MIKLSTQNLSADGTRASTEANTSGLEVSPETALAALTAFAALTPVDLDGIDPLIYLGNTHERYAVQNSRGKLLIVRLPESVNSWEEGTAAEIVTRLTEGGPVRRSPAVASSAEEPDTNLAASGRTPLRRFGIGSFLAGTAVIALVVGWLTFSRDVPEGLTLVSDANKIRQLHAQFNGRYGSGEHAGEIVLELANGKCRGMRVGTAGSTGTIQFETAYQYGMRGDKVVLAVENGALLEPRADGSLNFLEITYPRQVR